MKRARPSSLARSPRGFTLVAALMMLIVITIIGIALMRSSGLLGKMAGNTREKGRAFEAAEATLQYAEWWLSQNATTNSPINCNGAQSVPQICNNAIANPTANGAWSVGYTYNPPFLTQSPNGGSQTYYHLPQLYIQYLGLNASGNGALYQLTAVGYGGNDSSVAVLQSTYTLYSGTSNLGK
ncbi:pilus assembly protein PilX [Chromobacterium phragmitis]|uniref:pilus assembly PilX family protein n=1 Tax=Chromobacterium phragmitis TaxID=2202141 RepID=UPI000DEC4A97|nr:PilX N-terminal domain-containing pilus assembly protein [Chromobacterium phragmitis]AXE28533.1 pilus assembly protein PilX [Chromobacterium phragmitis]